MVAMIIDPNNFFIISAPYYSGVLHSKFAASSMLPLPYILQLQDTAQWAGSYDLSISDLACNNPLRRLPLFTPVDNGCYRVMLSGHTPPPQCDMPGIIKSLKNSGVSGPFIFIASS
jgi:hypothetical protein